MDHKGQCITWWTQNEPCHGISNNVVCATSKSSDQPAHTRSLIRAFASRLNILWVFSWTSFGVSKLKRRLHRLVWVYTCQNATLLEITCHGSKYALITSLLLFTCLLIYAASLVHLVNASGSKAQYRYNINIETVTWGQPNCASLSHSLLTKVFHLPRQFLQKIVCFIIRYVKVCYKI